ncbi:MAG: hypothetical protein OXD44_05685, partial [Gammaproteobacteria bacterium]|nr:hypothetical protein [Gammaproteobacteria bacterium]
FAPQFNHEVQHPMNPSLGNHCTSQQPSLDQITMAVFLYLFNSHNCWLKRLDCIGQVRIPPREMLNYYSFIDIFFAMGKALQAEPIKTGEGQDSPGVEEREPEREVS